MANAAMPGDLFMTWHHSGLGQRQRRDRVDKMFSFACLHRLHGLKVSVYQLIKPPHTRLYCASCLQTHGRLQRHIAHHLLLPPLQQQLAAEGAAAAIAGRLAADTASSSSSARASLYGTGRFVKAHRLSPTALALTSDEQKMYSVSKDGLILKWDVETMQRVQVFRWAHLRGGWSSMSGAMTNNDVTIGAHT
jgi:hypothetical protein